MDRYIPNATLQISFEIICAIMNKTKPEKKNHGTAEKLSREWSAFQINGTSPYDRNQDILYSTSKYDTRTYCQANGWDSSLNSEDVPTIRDDRLALSRYIRQTRHLGVVLSRVHQSSYGGT